MRRRSVISAALLGGAAVVAGPGRAGAAAPGPSDAGAAARVRELATAYLADRASRITAAGPLGVTAATPAQASALSTAADRLDGVRHWLNDVHGGYRRASTSVAVSRFTAERTRVVATVREQTDLYYTDVAPGAVTHMTYWADHEVDLRRDGSRWLLAGASYLPADPFSTPATQFADELPADLRALNDRRAARSLTAVEPAGKPSAGPAVAKAAGSGVVALAGYNYTAMVNYARAWATGRNPAYPTYSDDCTNFISQVMRAGGWATVGSSPRSDRKSSANWWYTMYPSTCSYTWGGAENWYWFATGSGRTYIIDMYSMGAGDVLQYDYDYDYNISHTQVCTGRDSTGPLMTQHGSDYRDKRLKEIMATPANLNAWKYAHRT
ncbi:amidase domain-containing protein [Dactylosporangium sp. NPDC005572]|uniref:amidase domain-containing protein n=1 Tax=Dactylosporangium sp. NPDC005572 TaxID=3156889 RepID=UPI0033BB3818